MIHWGVSVQFSQLSLWHMQIWHQTRRLLTGPFLILQYLVIWQGGVVVAVLLRHTVHIKKAFFHKCIEPAAAIPFIFHKWINTVADPPPCPSKTLASYPYSVLQRYMKHARPCSFDFIRFPCDDVKKWSASVSSLPLQPPLCLSCSTIAE